MADEVLHLKTRKYPAFARCGYYYQQTFYRKLMPEAHDHDFYEIICTLEGSFAHVINGVPYAFAPGWVTLLRPGDVHSLRAQQPGTNVFSLSVAPDEMERFLAAYGCALTRAPVFSISAVQQSEYRAQL